MLAEKARLCFNSIRKYWVICSMDAVGLSGGLLSAWDPKIFQLSAFTTHLGFLLEGNIRGFSGVVNFINIYGPYSDRLQFWDSAKSEGLLNCDNLIRVGHPFISME